MKNILLLIFCLLIINSDLHAKINCDEATTANELLKKVSDKLNSLKTITYDYHRELHYLSENISNKTSGRVTFDFSSLDSLFGFRYYISNESSNLIFNGTEQFVLNKKEKTIEINDHPALKNFKSLSLFYNSVLTLKKGLPLIISDGRISKSVSDTTISNINYSMINFVLNSKTLGHLGTIEPLSTQRKIIYKVIIEKNTYLPQGILWSNSVNDDHTITWFKNLKVNASDIADKAWFYSTYLDDYKIVRKEKQHLIQVGEAAPNFELLTANGDIINSNAFNGKVVLLEFWIKNCGYCISAVPILNAIKQKYMGKNLEILAINAYDSKGEIDMFIKKNNVKFRVATMGKKLAKLFGVDAFPTAVLINKNGKIAYSGPIDILSLEKVILDNL